MNDDPIYKAAKAVYENERQFSNNPLLYPEFDDLSLREQELYVEDAWLKAKQRERPVYRR